MSKQNRKSKRLYIPIMAIGLAIVLSVQIFSLYHKLSSYKAREAVLQNELEAAKSRSDALSDYEEYTKSDEYVFNTARTKLGLVKENEIIFKEK